MYARKPINRAMETILNTAAKISGSHESVQVRVLFLGTSGDSGSSGRDSDSEGFEDLPSAKILCIACFAIGEEYHLYRCIPMTVVNH